jgi:hypothetical protein
MGKIEMGVIDESEAMRCVKNTPAFIFPVEAEKILVWDWHVVCDGLAKS